MRLFIFALILFSCTPCFALGYRHQISFGTQGLGWSGVSEQIHTQHSSSFKRVDYFYSNLGMNYAYLLTNRLQVGGFFKVSHQEHKFNKKGGGTSSCEIESGQYGLFTLYNFSQELEKAFYIGLSLSMFHYEEENSHDFSDAESKSPFELDDRGEISEFIMGHRFDFRHWNIEHLTFSPQFGLFYATHSKDFKDQGVKDGVGVSFQPVKFDFLF